MRHPRFERDADAFRCRLTDRDRQIVAEVARHRFLTSRQIVALVGGSQQHLLRRLQKLFHAGYLDRPRAQLHYFSREGSRPIVYGLGRKGVRELPSGSNRPFRPSNPHVEQFHIEHTLRVAEVAIAFVRALRFPGAPRLQLEGSLLPEDSDEALLRWMVTVRFNGMKQRVGLVPDRTLAIDGPADSVWYFVEADRGTMPLARRTLATSSLQRKLLAYAQTWRSGILRERFNCTRFRVLFVTTSSERARRLRELASQLDQGRGLFLITDLATFRTHAGFERPEALFELPWLSATGESTCIQTPFTR